jgi:nucleoside-triphosphatase THEP1
VQVFIDSPDSLLASFASGTNPGQLILVTGPSGSGKTRWCMRLVERANALGIHAAGLVSPAVFEGEHKIGINLLDLGSGIQRTLAVRGGETGGGPIIGEWHFDNETLKWGNDLLAHAAEYPLLILDELGPLELERGVGLTNSSGLIAERGYRLACVVVRPSLLPTAQKLWSWGEIFDVHPSNRAEASV